MGSGHSSRFDSSGHTSSRHAAFSLSPFSTLRPHHSSRCGNEHMMYFEPGLDGREMMHDPFEYMDDVVSGRCAGGFPGMWKRPRDWSMRDRDAIGRMCMDYFNQRLGRQMMRGGGIGGMGGMGMGLPGVGMGGMGMPGMGMGGMGMGGIGMGNGMGNMAGLEGVMGMNRLQGMGMGMPGVPGMPNMPGMMGGRGLGGDEAEIGELYNGMRMGQMNQKMMRDMLFGDDKERNDKDYERKLFERFRKFQMRMQYPDMRDMNIDDMDMERAARQQYGGMGGMGQNMGRMGGGGAMGNGYGGGMMGQGMGQGMGMHPMQQQYGGMQPGMGGWPGMGMENRMYGPGAQQGYGSDGYQDDMRMGGGRGQRGGPPWARGFRGPGGGRRRWDDDDDEDRYGRGGGGGYGGGGMDRRRGRYDDDHGGNMWDRGDDATRSGRRDPRRPSQGPHGARRREPRPNGGGGGGGGGGTRFNDDDDHGHDCRCRTAGCPRHGQHQGNRPTQRTRSSDDDDNNDDRPRNNRQRPSRHPPPNNRQQREDPDPPPTHQPRRRPARNAPGNPQQQDDVDPPYPEARRQRPSATYDPPPQQRPARAAPYPETNRGSPPEPEHWEPPTHYDERHQRPDIRVTPVADEQSGRPPPPIPPAGTRPVRATEPGPQNVPQDAPRRSPPPHRQPGNVAGRTPPPADLPPGAIHVDDYQPPQAQQPPSRHGSPAVPDRSTTPFQGEQWGTQHSRLRPEDARNAEGRPGSGREVPTDVGDFEDLGEGEIGGGERRPGSPR